MDQVVSFGKPYPTIIFTGGDPLKRKDLFDLLSYARNAGVPFAVSPAVTELLTDEALGMVRSVGASSISISLDGACAETHDSIRGVKGTYDMTIEGIRKAVELGINVQVNTAIMKMNFNELPQIFHLIRSLGVKVWELFFLVKVGRGTKVMDLAPEECESVCNLLYDASCYDVTIRCVEAPFIRRVASERSNMGGYWQDETYLDLRRDFLKLNGGQASTSTLRPRGTLDGDGIIFVAHDGTVYPGGLLPVRIGNVKESSLVRTYRESDLLRSIRERRLNGHCGICEFKGICGGSRARAYAHQGDPLGSDPSCIHAIRKIE